MNKADPPEVKVTPTLPALAFNFDQLKAWATDVAKNYAGLVVTEDAVADEHRIKEGLRALKSMCVTFSVRSR